MCGIVRRKAYGGGSSRDRLDDLSQRVGSGAVPVAYGLGGKVLEDSQCPYSFFLVVTRH